MQESFKPLGTKQWEVTDTAIIYNQNEELLFADCTSISIISTPQTGLVQGAIQLVHKEKTYVLGFKHAEQTRAHQVVSFVKDAIDAAHGKKSEYRYRLLSHTGSYIEVFDSYLFLYFMPVGTVIRNIARGGTTGRKRIDFSDIMSVQFKEPSSLSAGFIQIAYLGSVENKQGTIAAVNDENSIIFREDQLQLAQEMVEFIEKRRTELRNQPAGVAVQQISSADELLKYKQLLDSGVINQQEFDMKKSELLGMPVINEAESIRQKEEKPEEMIPVVEEQPSKGELEERLKKEAEERKRIEDEKQLAQERLKAAEVERFAQEAAQKAAEAERLSQEEARKTAEAKQKAEEEKRRELEAKAQLLKAQAQLEKEQRLAKKEEKAQARKEENQKRAEKLKDTTKNTRKAVVAGGKKAGKVTLIILAIVALIIALLLSISKFAYQAIEGVGVIIAIVLLIAIGLLFLKLSKK